MQTGPVDFLDRFGLEHPVVQAGMGGGVVGPDLAGEVSAAGALGTVGILPPQHFRTALVQARERADGRPVAANLLVPFCRPDHVRACAEARVALVVLHGGLGRRWLSALHEAGLPGFCTVGTLDQARAALAAGADGLVVQGGEAGGHLMGDVPLHALLPDVRELGGFPLLAAGGIADAAGVRAVLAAGANAAVAGTRFLMTDESRAHAEYKERVRRADHTLRTTLFGVGWPLAHRVIPNAATERWCGPGGQIPGWLHRIHQASIPLARALPMRSAQLLGSAQRVGRPLYGPGLPLMGMPAAVVDRSALYAGETVSRIDDVIPARTAVTRLAPG